MASGNPGQLSASLRRSIRPRGRNRCYEPASSRTAASREFCQGAVPTRGAPTTPRRSAPGGTVICRASVQSAEACWGDALGARAAGWRRSHSWVSICALPSALQLRARSLGGGARTPQHGESSIRKIALSFRPPAQLGGWRHRLRAGAPESRPMTRPACHRPPAGRRALAKSTFAGRLQRFQGLSGRPDVSQAQESTAGESRQASLSGLVTTHIAEMTPLVRSKAMAPL